MSTTDRDTHRAIIAAASGGQPALVQATDVRNGGHGYASNGRTWWLMPPGRTPPGTCTATPDQALAQPAGLVLWEELVTPK